MPDQNQDQPDKTPWTPKRIAAIVAIVLLVGMYLFTLYAALTARPGADQLFRASLGMTIGVPILLWIVLWAWGKFFK